MNILLSCSKYMPEYSGAGYRAHNLYKRLVASHPEIKLDVLCGSETENDTRKYEYDGFIVNRIACKQYLHLDSGLIRRWQNICNFHSENRESAGLLNKLPAKPDIIHVFGQNYVTVSVIDYAIKNSIPLLVELVTDLQSPYYYVPFPFKCWISTRPGNNFMFVCISEKLKEICLRHGISVDNIWCRPNPVDETKFKPVSLEKKCELRRKLTKFGKDDKVVSYIAKYRPSKNQSFLVDMMKSLPDEYKLFIKGPLVESGVFMERDKEYFSSIGKKEGELGLRDRIQLETGFCENPEEYYQMSDIYAFPSVSEGLGTPVLESLACGVPVVANNILKVTDVWIKEGKNGYLSLLDPVEFSQKIIDAAKISKDALLGESKALMSKASTGIIDEQYINIIKRLAKS